MSKTVLILTALLASSTAAVFGAVGDHQSLTASSWIWSGWESILRLLSLRDYNTRVVLLGATLLGIASGTIGTFMLLRKRALMGDAISHATLPGIGLAFMVMVAAGGTGKSLPGLLLGALIAGLIGMGAVLLIRGQTRLKEDVALGAVLSVFFGLGISILVVVTKMRSGHAAGLESFIYGKTASMVASDAWLIAGVALLIVLVCGLLFKEFKLLCFDQDYAGARGWPVFLLDGVMMTLVVCVTVIGLQAVGLILVIALLVIPPAAARFWTHDLGRTVILAALLGGVGCLIGAGISALTPRMPAGAIMVVTSGSIFLVSMLLGAARGIVPRWVRYGRLTRKVARQHLLRALYEAEEQGAESMKWEELMRVRSWSSRSLRRQLRRCRQRGHLFQDSAGAYRLTDTGRVEAQNIVRNHRLWERYLITHADIAPSHVDRDADQVEHVIGRAMVDKLERLVAAEYPHRVVPPSPHPLKNL